MPSMPLFASSVPLPRRHVRAASFYIHRRDGPVCSAHGKPEKVAVVGAGVGGLSTALTLLRTPGTGVQSVSLFESRETLDTALGAAVGDGVGIFQLRSSKSIPFRVLLIFLTTTLPV